MDNIINQVIELLQANVLTDKQIRVYVNTQLIKQGINKNDFMKYLVDKRAYGLLMILGDKKALG